MYSYILKSVSLPSLKVFQSYATYDTTHNAQMEQSRTHVSGSDQWGLGRTRPLVAHQVTCQGHVATIIGTEGNDDIEGTDDDDVIAGLAGNDKIQGKGSNDILCGGKGQVILEGGDGNDLLAGGPGQDTLKGQKGDDTLRGQKGDDALNGGSGTDSCINGEEIEQCENDTIDTPSITITQPADGSILTETPILVQGTVDTGGTEVGVVVNTVLAAVEDDTFAVFLSVTPETTELTAVATAATGTTASHSIAVVTSATLDSAIERRASPKSGIAPVSVAFSLLGGPVSTQVELDADGDGIVDLSGPSLDGLSFTYTDPGLYFPMATLTDTQGQTHTASGIVQVVSLTALDTLLQAKWTDLKDALVQGDTTQALTHIANSSRSRYEALFQALAADLSNIDTILTSITLLEIRGNEALYEMMRTDDGVVKSVELRFVLDAEDGIWRLSMF